MAVAYVKDAGLKVAANFSGTTNGSFGTLPGVGNHVIVGISNYSPTSYGVIATVTDNQSNSYAEDKEASNTTGANSADVYSTKVATSSGTYTITVDPTDASNNYIAWSAVEFSGIASSSWLDRTGSNNSTTGDANATATAANTTTSGVSVGVASVQNADSDINVGDTPPTGYTNIRINEDANSYIGLSFVYKIYSSSETSSAQWTHDNDSQAGWAAVIATYKEGAGALTVSVSDSVTISESKTVSLPDALQVNKSDNITVSEDKTVDLPIGTLSITVSDNLTVTEDKTVSLPDALQVNKSDSITVSEDKTVILPSAALSVSVSDSVTLSETAQIVPLIYYKAQQTTDITVATASPVVDAPAGIADGDLLLMFITTNTGANTASPIAGWTRIGTEVDTGTDATTAVYYKIASSEGASWTMTNLFDATEIGRFVVLVYGEVNASPINVSNQADAGTVTAVAGPSITTTTNRTMVIQMAGTDPGTGTYTATPDTDPVGTERFDGKDGSSNAYIAIQEYYQNALGAIALDLTGLTSDSYGSHQFALNPKVSINKSESVTIAESVSVEVTAAALIVNVTDSVTVSESNAVALPDALQVSKSETVTTAEAVAAVVRAAWYNADSIAINTGSLVSGAIQDTWSDNSTRLVLAETAGTPGFSYDFYFYSVPATAFSVTINGYYSGNVAHNVKIQQYNFTTTGWTDLTAAASDFPADTTDGSYQFSIFGGVNYNQSGEIRLRIIHTSAGNPVHQLLLDEIKIETIPTPHVDETINTTDTPAVSIGALVVNVSDTVTTAESVSLTVGVQINVTDAAAVAESVSAAVIAQVGVTDAVTVAESASAITGAPQVSASEMVTVSESVQVVVVTAGVYTVSVSEAVTVAEAVSATLGALTVSVTDAVSVAENVTVSVAAFALSVSDTATVSESAALAVSAPQINLADGITLTESVTVAVVAAGTFVVNVSDSVTLSESVSASIPALDVVSSETVNVSENISAVLFAALVIAVTSNVTLTESVGATVRSATNPTVDTWTLHTRDTSLALKTRSGSLTLRSRDTSWDLEER